LNSTESCQHLYAKINQDSRLGFLNFLKSKSISLTLSIERMNTQQDLIIIE
jgi:hypothetical protein